MNPRISIFIPAYNSAHYLPDAVRSALAQTLPPCEVLILDDGSQDNTAEVAKSFPPPVRYVALPHRGVAATRNAGLDAFVGDYVVNLDADDRLDPHFLEKTFSMLSRQRDPAIAYCYTQCRFFGTTDRVSHYPDFDAALLPIRNFILATVLMRGDVARRFRYSEDIPYHEDYDYFIKLLSAGYRGVLLDEPLLLYRQHEANRTTINKRWLQHLDIIERLIARYPSLYPRETARKARERAREKTFLAFIESRKTALPPSLRIKQFLWMLTRYPRHAETWRHARVFLKIAR